MANRRSNVSPASPEPKVVQDRLRSRLPDVNTKSSSMNVFRFQNRPEWLMVRVNSTGAARMVRVRDEADYVQLKLRIKESLRAKLEREATERQITLNAAVADRLERSFQYEDSLGGRRTTAVLRGLAETTRFLQGDYGRDDEWLDDRGKFNQVVATWNIDLERIKPKEDDADRQARQEGLDEFKKMLVQASPDGARRLRSIAAMNSLNGNLDPKERAEWAALAQQPGKAA
jgi:hypothetical protein